MIDGPGRALIVTLGRSRGSLAAARALHEAGWTVGVGTPAGDGMVTASRSVTGRHRVPRPRGDGTAFHRAVQEAVAEGGYDVVFGGADDWMAALSVYADHISATVAHPDAATVAEGLDKIALARRAEEVGLATPRTVVADEVALAGWHGPVVVKCRQHWVPGQEHLFRIESRRHDTAAEATERVEMVREAGLEAVLQEPVDGRLTALIGLVHEGRLQGRVQQVSPALWPTPSGVSSRAVTVPVDADLADRCEQLLLRIGWTGLVELQFLRGPDGRAQLIDLNGRFYGSMALAHAAGPNLADAWARQVLDRPVPVLRDARAGVRYVWLAGDFRRASLERRGGLATDLLDTVRWSRGAATSVWDRHDRGPARHLLANRGRRALRADDD